MSENTTMEVNSLTANEVAFEELVKGYLKQVDEDLATLPSLEEIEGDYGLAHEAVHLGLGRIEAGVKYFMMSVDYNTKRLAVRSEITDNAWRAFREMENKIAELKKEYNCVLQRIEKKTRMARKLGLEEAE